jgi:hypothetical protein
MPPAVDKPSLKNQKKLVDTQQHHPILHLDYMEDPCTELKNRY